jgi:hypothetical protein
MIAKKLNEYFYGRDRAIAPTDQSQQAMGNKNQQMREDT